MYLPARAAARRVPVSGLRRAAARAARGRRRPGARGRRLREREPARPGSRGAAAVALRINLDHHHDNSLRRREPRRRVCVVHRRAARRRVRTSRRDDHAGDRRAALHRARHGHRPLPVREHDAQGAAAGGGSGRGGSDVHKVFQGVYESVQFAKLKLLARALERAEVYEGGRLVISYLLRDDFGQVGAAEPYSEGIIDYLRAVEGADMAALIREPPRGGTPARRISLRSSLDESTCPRSRMRPATAAATVRRPASRATTRSRRSDVSRRAVPAGVELDAAARALEPAGIILVDKPAGPSSFAREAVSGAARARDRACRHARSLRDGIADRVVRIGD